MGGNLSKQMQDASSELATEDSSVNTLTAPQKGRNSMAKDFVNSPVVLELASRVTWQDFATFLQQMRRRRGLSQER